MVSSTEPRIIRGLLFELSLDEIGQRREIPRQTPQEIEQKLALRKERVKDFRKLKALALKKENLNKRFPRLAQMAVIESVAHLLIHEKSFTHTIAADHIVTIIKGLGNLDYEKELGIDCVTPLLSMTITPFVYQFFLEPCKKRILQVFTQFLENAHQKECERIGLNPARFSAQRIREQMKLTDVQIESLRARLCANFA